MFPLMHFKIKDRSMEPTLKPEDYIIVDKLSYIFLNPKKGDIIVFKHPKDKNKFLIKRISSVAEGNKYFVIGDNKKFSSDSRHFGLIKRNLIIGKLFICIKQ